MPLSLFSLDFKHIEDTNRIFLYPGDSSIFKLKHNLHGR